MKRLFITVTVLACITAACNNNPPTSTTAATDSAATMSSSKNDMLEKNKETALASVQAFNNHNVDEALKNVTADAVDYADGSTPAVKGIDSIKAGAQMFMKAFPDVKGENLMAIAEGNKVAVFGDWSGTFKGEMMGMKPTNKSYKVKDVDVFTFNDEGKITEHRSVQSMQTIMMQVGAKMKK
jgi:predicted ester cyclase